MAPLTAARSQDEGQVVVRVAKRVVLANLEDRAKEHVVLGIVIQSERAERREALHAADLVRVELVDAEFEGR